MTDLLEVSVTAVPTQRKRRGRGMEREEMVATYPSLKSLSAPPGRAVEGAWVATFSARPDAMQALLADYIKQVHTKPGRIGQRPMPKEADVDFQTLLYGEVSDMPLLEVLPDLVKALAPHLRSERTFSQAIHMSKTQYRRMMNGQYEPTVNELRTIAKVVGKPPVYFSEYRKAILNLMDERPGIATKLYQQYIEVHLDK
jgi:transcriptional regulator with XRE-family HTH domain